MRRELLHFLEIFSFATQAYVCECTYQYIGFENDYVCYS